MSCELFLKFALHFAVRLTRNSKHNYQATNTLSQSNNHLKEKNTHINYFTLSLS